MLRNKKKNRKGLIQGVVVAAAAIGLLISLLIVAVLLKFYSDSEKKLSDRVFFGLSSINYFYMTEKNINEFTQIVTEITAKELGEQCGGFGCYSWGANNPTYQDLRDKFEETLRGKITGFPKQIGGGGKISFASPKITGLEMDENHVSISLEPQQVYRESKGFSVKATSEWQTEVDKKIRYLLLAKTGQRLYGNGTYVRDWNKIYVNSGKFDCNGDGKADKTIAARTALSGAGLNGCKIIDISFDIDNNAWNSYKTNCYSIINSTDAGINAGKVEGGKIYAQIDNMLEKSLVCGIGGTDGLASITDIKGEVSKSGTSQPTCTADDAKGNAWQNSGIDSKINSILGALHDQISTTYSGITISQAVSISIQNSETIVKNPPFGSKTACDSCREWKFPNYGSNTGNPSCTWSNGDEGTFCSWSSNYACTYYGNQESGSTTTSANYAWSGSSMCGRDEQTLSRQQSWSNGIFSETRHDYSYHKGTSGSGTPYITNTYSCYFGGYYKFTFTPDISFKIIDSTLKVVKKGTTDFEDLYLAVKFKPDSPYVVGG